MKFIILISIFLTGTGILYAGDISPASTQKIKVDKNKAKEGVGMAKEVLADPKSRNPGFVDDNITDLLRQLKSGKMLNDMKSVTGENDGKITSFGGNKSVNGKIGCLGNTKLASVAYFVSAGGKGFDLALEGGKSLNLSGIKGVCENGFVICDKPLNSGLCKASLDRTPESMKAYHSCNAFENAVCRDWHIAFNKAKEILIEPVSGTCRVVASSNQSISDTLTNQISSGLSKAGFTIGRVDKQSGNAVFYSMQSDNCSGAAFGSGLKDINDLSSLYDTGSVSMPDASQALEDAVNDSDSIYNLISQGNKIDFGGGATIGQLTFDKCSVDNNIIVAMDSVEKKDKFSGKYNFCTDHVIDSRVRRSGSQIYIEFRGGDGRDGDYLKNCEFWSGAEAAKANGGWFAAYTVSAPYTLKEAVLGYTVAAGGGCEGGQGGSSITGMGQNNVICSAPGSQTPEISWELEVIYSEDNANPKLISSNSCEALEDNGECVLYNESVCGYDNSSCAYRVKDGKKQSFIFREDCYPMVNGVYTFSVCPLGNSFSVSGLSGSFIIPSSPGLGYSHIRREYKCSPKPTGMEDFESGLGDIFDIIGEGSKDITIPETCYVQFCSTAKKYDKNNIYGDGSTSSSLGNASSVSITIKQCEPSAGKSGIEFLCPLEVDETVREKCSCDNKDQLINNLEGVLMGFVVAEELKKYVDCDNASKGDNGSINSR